VKGAKDDGTFSLMAEDNDTWRCAHALLHRYGDDARAQASRRADECLESGDVEGARIWRSVLRAVEEMQRVPREDDPVN
jgi:hypothetical protein